jgi:hypothetical protein
MADYRVDSSAAEGPLGTRVGGSVFSRRWLSCRALPSHHEACRRGLGRISHLGEHGAAVSEALEGTLGPFLFLLFLLLVTGCLNLPIRIVASFVYVFFYRAPLAC